MLINEKYIGNNVWNRRSFKLKEKRVRNPPDLWLRAEGAFEAIFEEGLFRAAQVRRSNLWSIEVASPLPRRPGR